MNRQTKIFLNFLVILFVFVYIINIPESYGKEENGLRTEEEIIVMVLNHLWSGSKYTVVSPETTFCRLNISDKKEMEQERAYLLKKFEGQKQDIKNLIDRFFTLNRTPIQLSIQSNTEKGYFVDYTGEYEGYFKENGGGWNKWYREHPNADGSTEVSRPVYDDKTGVIIIYVGTQTHWLSGVGNVIVFQLENNSLKEIARVMVWIS